ncbi:MAG: hypothetical protein U0746_20955 [Gemmataceae bacterium]
MWLVASFLFVAIPMASVRGDEPRAGNLVVGAADRATAETNRRVLENWIVAAKGATIQLPAGFIHLDRGLRVTGPVVLAGQGTEKTVLKNSHIATPFGDNCSLQAWGGGYGYVDAIDGKPDGRRVVLKGNEAAKYDDAGLAYFFHYDGYTNATGMAFGRRRVLHGIAASRTLILDGEGDQRWDSAKWLVGSPIHDIVEGATEAKLIDPADAVSYRTGMSVYVTNGPSIGNSLLGEYRTVTAVEAGGVVRINRPLRRGYAQAALARIKSIDNVTIRDLTIGRPANPDSVPAFVNGCRGWRFERCHFEGVLDLAICGDITIRDCTGDGYLRTNTSHDVTATGGRWAGYWGEEGSMDIRLESMKFVGSPQTGIGANTETERVTVRGVRIEAARDSAVSTGGGREWVFEDVTIAESPKGKEAYSFFGGDRLRVNGVRSDRGVVFCSGRDMKVSGVQAPSVFLGWKNTVEVNGQATKITTPNLRLLSKAWNVSEVVDAPPDKR